MNRAAKVMICYTFSRLSDLTKQMRGFFMFGKKRRSSLLIEPYKQLRFGFMFLAVNMMFSTLIVAVFAHFLWDMYEALSVYFKLDQAQSMVTLEKFAKPASIGTGLVLLFILATLFLSARYTHQIYGPMVSIRRFLDELIAGRSPQPITLRSSDQLQDLVDRLNRVGAIFRNPSETEKILITHLDALIQGEKPQPIHLNDGDPLKEIADRINILGSK